MAAQPHAHFDALDGQLGLTKPEIEQMKAISSPFNPSHHVRDEIENWRRNNLDCPPDTLLSFADICRRIEVAP